MSGKYQKISPEGRTPYYIVPNSFRELASGRKKTSRKPTEPIVEDLLSGKTVLLDVTVPYNSESVPYRHLYTYFSSRGLRLRSAIVDMLDYNVNRGVLMWVERNEFDTTKS